MPKQCGFWRNFKTRCFLSLMINENNYITWKPIIDFFCVQSIKSVGAIEDFGHTGTGSILGMHLNLSKSYKSESQIQVHIFWTQKTRITPWPVSCNKRIKMEFFMNIVVLCTIDIIIIFDIYLMWIYPFTYFFAKSISTKSKGSTRIQFRSLAIKRSVINLKVICPFWATMHYSSWVGNIVHISTSKRISPKWTHWFK